jgi:hypothetical protein
LSTVCGDPSSTIPQAVELGERRMNRLPVDAVRDNFAVPRMWREKSRRICGEWP